MPRPTTRVLALLELLQARRITSGSELARRLEVDPRTLRRYIATLEELGIPITTERGRHGGYMLVPGFRMPPLLFTNDEAMVISLGLAAVRQLGLADAAPVVEGLQAKIERVMPEPVRERVRSLGERTRIALDAPVPGGNPATLRSLSEAMQSGHRVQLDYRGENGQASAREVDPWGLAFRRGHWYMSGHCHLRGGLRSFRLDRISSVEPLAQRFTPPAQFDAVEHLRASIAGMARAHEVSVLLRADLAKAVEEVPPHLGVLLPRGKGVLLAGSTDSPPWYARQLAQLPFGMEIIGCAALRQAVHAHARALLAS